MASIDDLRTLLVGKFSDGRKKLSVYVNEIAPADNNCLRLFYIDPSEFTTETRAPYYNQRCQVTVRHKLYDKARTIAFSAVERINANRKNTSTVYFQPISAPIFLGEDEFTGGYVFGFDVNLRGGK